MTSNYKDKNEQGASGEHFYIGVQDDVYKKKEKNFKNELWCLIQSCKEGISSSLLTPINFSTNHISILKSSIENTIFYFTNGNHGKICSENIWFDLIKRNNTIRKFPTSWNENFLRLNKFFHKKDHEYLPENFLQLDEKNIYNLGLHNIYRLVSPDLILKHRLINEKGFYPLFSLRGDNLEEVAEYYSYLLVKGVREKNDVNEYVMFLENYIESYLNNNYYLTAIVINSLNFYYQKISVKKFLYYCDLLISNLSESNLSHRQILSNVNYHLAKYYYNSNLLDESVKKIQQSIRLDNTFYDYYYHLAIIYHDKKEYDLAKNTYENALKLSCMDEYLINDYGYLLNEMKSNELNSWISFVKVIE